MAEKKGKNTRGKTGSGKEGTPRPAKKPGIRSKAKARTSSGTGSGQGKNTGTAGKSRAEEEAVIPDEIISSPGGTNDGGDFGRSEGVPRTGKSTDKPVVYDPVSAYYQTIRHYPVLTREEEKHLALRYLEKDDIDAAYRLVTSNLKLVIKIAMEYRRLWKEIVDLIQEGNMGLMQAVKKYDPYRGVRFSSYAAWWIRAYIIRYIMNNTRMVKLGTTQAQRTLYFQLGKERERLKKLGIEPDSKTLAKSLNVKESEVEEMAMRLSSGDLSLEATRGPDNDYSLLDTIPALQPDTEKTVADAQVRSVYLEKLSEFIAGLEERDRKIFTMRWMRDDPYTLQEVGEKLGVTRERIRQLEARILKNLRDYLQKEGLDASDFFS